jgi:hypothetical protein
MIRMTHHLDESVSWNCCDWEGVEVVVKTGEHIPAPSNTGSLRILIPQLGTCIGKESRSETVVIEVIPAAIKSI